MASPTTARSIAEVAQELVHVELVGALVQTVFPIHACMPPTANGETQDYGTVGSDGPIEGATKVFQVTLREPSVPRSSSSNSSSKDYTALHHLINVYFYDEWADKYHRCIGVGDEIEVTGSAARLVYPDPSASEKGDHPFCLVFHTLHDDTATASGHDNTVTASGVVAADRLGGGDAQVGAGGKKLSGAEDAISCKVIQKAARLCARDGAGSRGDGAAATRRGRDDGGKGARGQSGASGKNARASYVYTNLADLRVQQEKGNVYGVVCCFTHRHQSKGKDMTNSLSLLDETNARSPSEHSVPCNFFSPSVKGLPNPLMVGDIVRLHRAKVQEYRGRLQLVASGGTSWLIIRKKQAVRETFQKVALDNTHATNGAGGRAGGDVEDEDPDPDGSPPSGPDAGGGEIDTWLPAAEWEVHASSEKYTLSQVDENRCNALHTWMVNQASSLWLKPSSEAKVWVQDLFRRPHSGPVVSETEVDLVCCLTSKHERTGGGAGSLCEIFVADGTGFSSSVPGNEWDNRRDSALLKGMRAALRQPSWSPGNPRPPPFPAHLKVQVAENIKELEALALSTGMWVRLRRLTITKNTETGNMSARMKNSGSSINPMHPAMAEVQHVAKSFADHCSTFRNENSERSGRVGGDNSTSGNSISKAPPPPGLPQPHQPAATTSSLRPASSPIGDRAASEGRDGVQISECSSLERIVTKGGCNSTDNTRGGGGVSSAKADGGGSTVPSEDMPRPPSATTHRQKPPSTLPSSAAVASVQAAPLSEQDGDLRREEKAASADCGSVSSSGVAAGDSHSNGDSSGMIVPANGKSTRGTKRPLPAAVEERDSMQARGGLQVSNLGVVRSRAAPTVFDVRARIVSHWPSNVEHFVRKGPGQHDGPRYLFTLRLEDDYGTIEAVAAGPDASRLLPGAPSPSEFLSRPNVQATVERVLARLEGIGLVGRKGGMIRFRLRSYLVPLVAAGKRGEKCKRYSIIAPTQLASGQHAHEV